MNTEASPLRLHLMGRWAHPVVWRSRRCAVCPHVVVLVAPGVVSAELEPPMLVAGVIGDEVHDQLQLCNGGGGMI